MDKSKFVLFGCSRKEPPKGPQEMDYFELIPSDINNIIISYLPLVDELLKFLKVFNLVHVNWNTINEYHFGLYSPNITQLKYLTRLGAEVLINKLNLNYNIDELLDVKYLYLTLDENERIPSEIGYLSNLKALKVYGGYVNQLPDEITKLINLRDLSLSENKFKSIPTIIFKLTNLMNLYLRDNEIERVPPEIGNLINLRILDLSNNQIKQVPPELGNLRNLKELFLSNNQIERLPKELGNLTKLKKLVINNNLLNNIPIEIRKIPYISII